MHIVQGKKPSFLVFSNKVQGFMRLQVTIFQDLLTRPVMCQTLLVFGDEICICYEQTKDKSDII